MDNYVLQMTGISKSFDGVGVLHSVALSVERGKVTALVGENGAGKSTLMKILMGEYSADSGTILLDGKAVGFANSHQALSHGISMMFQEMSPFPDMSVAQNIYIGREPRWGCFVKSGEVRQKAKDLLESLNIKLDPDRLVKTLAVSEMQMLEIAKAVSHDSKIVVMDEPTSAITDSEVKVLFDTIGKLKEKGVAVIYITHKLDELFVIANRVCVLRDGNIISSRAIEDVDRQQMISEMVGRTISQVFPKVEKEIGDTVLKVEGLSRKGAFHDISFELKKGEILGFAGMVGAGRTEVVSALFGIDRASSGKIIFNGEKIAVRNPKDAIKHRFALVPEDRARCGLNLKSSVLSNLNITIISAISRFGFSNHKAEKAKTKEMVGKLRIKINSDSQIISSLSGGNQQKIVVGKWLLTVPDVVFMDEPTRGIDVGAKYEIYQLIQSLAKEGKAVLMISSEMPELIGMCDRIIVLKEGRMVGEIDGRDTTQEKIMEMIVNG